MKKLALLSAGFIALAVSASAAPAWIAGEGAVTVTDAAGTFASFTTLPAPSATDMAAGKTAFLIDGSNATLHGGSAMTTAPFLDGAPEANYPANLPNDGYTGITPCLSMGIDLAGTVDVGSVIVFAYNGDVDERSVAPFSVWTTTDATPSSTGNWTKIIDYTTPAILGGNDWYTSDPVDDVPTIGTGFWDNHTATFNGGAMACADSDSAPLAAGITGIRVDVIRAGTSGTLRNPLNTGSNVQAIGSPFIAEIDVLNMTDTQAFYNPPSAVENWIMF